MCWYFVKCAGGYVVSMVDQRAHLHTGDALKEGVDGGGGGRHGSGRGGVHL